jgi:hypothetical protein
LKFITCRPAGDDAACADMPAVFDSGLPPFWQDVLSSSSHAAIDTIRIRVFALIFFSKLFTCLQLLKTKGLYHRVFSV